MDFWTSLPFGEPILVAMISGFITAVGTFLLLPLAVTKDHPNTKDSPRRINSSGHLSIHKSLTPKSLASPFSSQDFGKPIAPSLNRRTFDSLSTKAQPRKIESSEPYWKAKGYGLKLKNRNLQLRLAHSALIASLTSVGVLFWTGSVFVTSPFAIITGVISWVYLRNREASKRGAVDQVWPDVIDHLVSGLHSGLSLAEALTSIAIRGPLLVQPQFLVFRAELLETGNFVLSCENLRDRFQSHGSDQILEAVLIAKSLGGSELLEIFRVLGNFLRQDLALRREIEIKHGWIKSSAHLSSAAPWILLLLLSSQPGTVDSFARPGGILILSSGLAMTFLAYFWMGKLGRLPEAPRVFGGHRN